jgi:sigma-E factor negative regulatory protein RseC
MEQGTVLEAQGNRILVQTQANACCENCSAGEHCAIGGDAQKREVWVENRVGALPGDEVEFYVPPGTSVLASSLLYLFPVIMLIAGIIIGAHYSGWFHLGRDASSAVGGVSFLLISFFIIKIISAYIKKRNLFVPVCTGVVSRKSLE